MEIFVNLPALLDEEPGPVSEELMQDIFARLKEEYKYAAADPEAYLSDNWSEGNFTFGAVDPEAVKARAQAWNAEIRQEAWDAMQVLLAAGSPAELSMDTPETYRLACAARLLDDHWYDYADKATAMNNSCGYLVLKTLLQLNQITDICRNPQDYAIVQVSPRS